MKKILALVAILLGLALPSSARGRLAGWCEDGNQTVNSAGISSTTRVQRSYVLSNVGCTVTVYNAGTVVIATIYSDMAGTPKANPFTAASSGQWFFYADSGRYDVKFSGSGIATPFTLGDMVPVEAANQVDCSAFPGADDGAKINACITATPAGTTWDARLLTSSPAAAATINVNKKGRLLMPPATLTSSAATNAMLISIQGAEVSCDNTANNYGGGPCILATTNATANVIAISGGAVSVHDLSLQYAGAGVRTGGSGLKFEGDSGATGGSFYRLEIDQGLWVPINMAEGGTAVKFDDIRITGTAGGTGRLWTAWQLGGCQAAGTPAELGCSIAASGSTDSSYNHIVIGYNIVAQSGAVVNIDAGIDTPEFNYLLVISSGDCHSITACGEGIRIRNTTAAAIPALAKPNWLRFYSTVVENVGGGQVSSEPAVSIRSGRSIRFDGNTAMVCGAQCFLIAPGTGATDALKNATAVDSVEITGIISAQAGQEIIRIENQAGNYDPITSNGLAVGDIKIHHNRIAHGSLAADNTYSAIYVAANVERFMIESNNFDRWIGGVTQKPKYFVEVAAGTSNNYIVQNNQWTAAHRGTGDFLDGGTGTAKTISPNLGSGYFIAINGIPFAMRNSAGTETGKIYVSSGGSDLRIDQLADAQVLMSMTGTSGNFNVQGSTRLAAGGDGQFNIRDSTNSAKRLRAGVDTVNSLAYMQATEVGVANWPLALSPGGGGVSIGMGTTAPPADGLRIASFLYLGTSTSASLGTPSNGNVIYCTNCNTPAVQGDVCATGGDNAGAEAHRIRGVWKCY